MSVLEEAYRRRFDAVLAPLAKAIVTHLNDYLSSDPRIDQITARPKSVDRFIAKSETIDKGELKYTEPLRQIQDQIGARIVTFYRSDIDRVAQILERYFRPVESKDMVPDSEWKFGYFGRHYIFLIPSDVIDPSLDQTLLPEVFELQLKTLFQHAWSEANHDLGYNPGSVPLSPDAERLLAYTSAQAWGADRVFDELFQETSKLSG